MMCPSADIRSSLPSIFKSLYKIGTDEKHKCGHCWLIRKKSITRIEITVNDEDHCQYHCWDRPLSVWKVLSG